MECLVFAVFICLKSPKTDSYGSVAINIIIIKGSMIIKIPLFKEYAEVCYVDTYTRACKYVYYLQLQLILCHS